MSAIGRVLNPPFAGPLKVSRRRLVEVVALAGLIIDEFDDADRVGAEGVLRGRVGVSARHPIGGGLDDADVQGLAVRLAHDLVERAVVGGGQRARGAVGGHAGGAAAA